MQCSKVKQKLKAYFDQELSGKEAQQISQHLYLCTACAQEAEFLSKTWELLLDLPEIAETPDLMPGVLVRIEQEPGDPFLTRMLRLLFPLRVPAVATAGLVIGLIIGLGIGNMMPTGHRATEQAEDPLYLEIFHDVPPHSVGDAYLHVSNSKEEERL